MRPGALCLLLAVLVVPGGCLDAGAPSAPDGYEGRTAALFEEVEVEVEAIRGLDVPDEAEIRVVNRSWVLETWGASEEEPAQYLRDRELVYRALLLIPRDYPYARVRNAQVGSFLAFAWEGDVYVVREHFNPDSPTAGETLAHEMEHLIQETHFPGTERKTYDGQRAHGAVVEGSAGLLGRRYAEATRRDAAGPGYGGVEAPVPAASVDSTQPGSTEMLSGFVYEHGSRYVEHLHSEGGWRAVDSALRSPPETTEEVLHPRREDGFEEVREGFELEGWRLVEDDRFGEFFVRVFLSTHLPDSDAEAAAHGWGGDRFVMYADGEDYAFQWVLRWDSGRDAEEFAEAVEEVLDSEGSRSWGTWVVDGEHITFEVAERKVVLRGGSSPAYLFPG
ncbi:MAG: hypothetical protein MAG715_00899 [Methanonatronarchaeales archaeon]|nr:hypothetical protein [Methanonatronarchaeales archaeon]